MSVSEQRMRFAQEIEQCSVALASYSPGAPLRKLQQSSQRLFDTSDNRLRTLGFIMDQWVKDYYLNFAGDIVTPDWQQIEQLRKELLQTKVSQALGLLARSVLEDKDPSEALELLIASYLNGLSEAKSVIERRYGIH